MVTVISRFRVRNGMEQEVRDAFLNRPRLVEKAPGFCGLEVLTDAKDPSIFLLLTRWTDQESFQTWHRSPAHHKSHEFLPKGLKLDASFTSVTVGDSIEDPAGVRNLSDALEGQTVALSQWLVESDAVFALLLAPDGTILSRNRAGERIFPADSADKPKLTIWDYLVCSDAQQLRDRVAAPEDGSNPCVLLNVMDGMGNQITLEVGLVRRGGILLLLGTHEHHHDTHFQAEILNLSNDLSVLMREGARKNRELKEANEKVERLARTDALTGLANRRTLHEALHREVVRAGRQNEPLSLILADLDHFKSVNDAFGHLTGDQVLVSAAAVFASQSRPYDVAARFGGEEFVLLLPGTAGKSALAIAERIRGGVASLEVPGYPKRVTVSLGVATWICGEGQEEFVARADAALYRAKKRGRNCVEAEVFEQLAGGVQT